MLSITAAKHPENVKATLGFSTEITPIRKDLKDFHVMISPCFRSFSYLPNSLLYSPWFWHNQHIYVGEINSPHCASKSTNQWENGRRLTLHPHKKSKWVTTCI